VSSDNVTQLKLRHGTKKTKASWRWCLVLFFFMAAESVRQKQRDMREDFIACNCLAEKRFF